MATYNRPSSLPTWCQDNQTNCTDAPAALSAAGFTQGSVPVAEYENSYRRNVGLWLGYLDQATTKQVLSSTINTDIRLVGGGNFTYSATSSTLSWDSALYLSVPGIPLADNAIAAGSVTLGSQTLAFVAANIPFSTQGSLTSGSADVQNVLSTSAIAVGQAVSGTGIASGTTVSAITDSTITLSQAATQTNQTATVTFVSTGALTVQSTTTQSFTPPANSVVIAVGQADSAIVGANSGQMVVRPLESKRLLGTGFANTLRLVAGQALSALQACFVASGAGGLTAGSAYPCDASASNGAQRAQFAGFANLTTSSGGTCHIVSNGVVGGFTGLSIGSAYYLDPANVGAITATKPSAVGQYVVPVGVAVSTSQLQVVPAASALAAPVVNDLNVLGNLTVQGSTISSKGFASQVDMGGLYVQQGKNMYSNGQTVPVQMQKFYAYMGSASGAAANRFWPAPSSGSVTGLTIFASAQMTGPLLVQLFGFYPNMARPDLPMIQFSAGASLTQTVSGVYTYVAKFTKGQYAFDSTYIFGARLGMSSSLTSDVVFNVDMQVEIGA